MTILDQLEQHPWPLRESLKKFPTNFIKISFQCYVSFFQTSTFFFRLYIFLLGLFKDSSAFSHLIHLSGVLSSNGTNIPPPPFSAANLAMPGFPLPPAPHSMPPQTTVLGPECKEELVDVDDSLSVDAHPPPPMPKAPPSPEQISRFMSTGAFPSIFWSTV